MKKTLALISAAVAALISCSKDAIVSEQTQPAGTPMTLSATLSADTKTTYVDDSGLKGSWEAKEEISVVSLDQSGNCLAIDTFTSTGEAGRRTAEFSGTITSTDAASYVCWYPAMLPVEEGSSYAYMSTPDYQNTSALSELYVNDKFFCWSAAYLLQKADGDLSHVAKRSILAGAATVTDGQLKTEMSNMLSVIKVTMSIPESAVGQTVQSFRIDSETGFSCDASWSYIRDVNELYTGGSGRQNYVVLYLDEITLGNTLTVYVPQALMDAVEGDKWTFSLNTSFSTVASKTLTVKSAKTFEKAKMYSISVDLE